jgi:hypothetical protein
MNYATVFPISSSPLSGFWKFLCTTYSIKKTTRGLPLTCGQQIAGVSSEDNTGQNKDK